MKKESAFGIDIEFEVSESGFAQIIPVAIEFKERNGVNIVSRSKDKTPWYDGLILIDAIRERADELAIKC
jgi:sulfate adenylyltransferase subunit 1 (EFTu-like GTPase family)